MVTPSNLFNPSFRKLTHPSSPPGSSLRIGIVHARWNPTLISALLAGARKSLLAAGVQPENIITQSVPGSYELPFAVRGMYAASQHQQQVSVLANVEGHAGGGGGGSSGVDLLGGGSVMDLTSLSPAGGAEEEDESAAEKKRKTEEEDKGSRAPFDAIIAIGALVKGQTMHFEYISDAVSHGLMKVQLEQNVPVIFGLLTLLTEEQGMERAGLTEGGHNHGEDWGNAAVELGVMGKGWKDGAFVG